MSHPSKIVSVVVPLKNVEAIEGPVGELSVPAVIAERGYEACSIWVTSKLIYLSNEIGRKGVAVVNTKTETSDDPEVAQVIRLFGVRVQEYLMFEKKQYDSVPN